MNIIFFGTPKFASEILKYLVDRNIFIKAVVTKKDFFKRSKRMESDVKKTAKKLNIPIYQPDNINSKEFFDHIKSYNPDIFIVVAYGKIFSKELISLAKISCINVHASLLPKYRGADPIRRCLMNREKKTGITIMEMQEKLDAGDILLQRDINISFDMNKDMLESYLLDMAKDMLEEVIELFKKHKIKKIVQDEKSATYAHKIKKEEMVIDWNDFSKNIYSKIKALSTSPSARCEIFLYGKKKILKVLDAKIMNLKIVNLKGKPKEILKFDKDNLCVGCKDGAICLLKVQLEGKKVIDISNFIKGIKEKPKFL